jgi:hypothetical protein
LKVATFCLLSQSFPRVRNQRLQVTRQADEILVAH